MQGQLRLKVNRAVELLNFWSNLLENESKAGRMFELSLLQRCAQSSGVRASRC